MSQWVKIIVCFVLSSAAFIAIAEVKTTAQASGPQKKNNSVNPRIQMMLRMQQRQLAESSLHKKLQEKEQILSALDSIEKQKSKPKHMRPGLSDKSLHLQQEKLTERLRVLTSEIQVVEHQLKSKI